MFEEPNSNLQKLLLCRSSVLGWSTSPPAAKSESKIRARIKWSSSFSMAGSKSMLRTQNSVLAEEACGRFPEVCVFEDCVLVLQFQAATWRISLDQNEQAVTA